MKKIILIVLFSITFIKTTYIETGKIVKINNEEIFVETNTKNLFSFYGNDWKVGDYVNLEIDGCATKNVSDDIIVNAWKISV